MERLKNKYKYLKLLNKIYCTFIWGGRGGHKTKQKKQPTNQHQQTTFPKPEQFPANRVLRYTSNVLKQQKK